MTTEQQQLFSPPEVTIQSRVSGIVKLADCMSALKEIESHTVDLIATDPPYEINFENNSWDATGNLNWPWLSEQFHRVLKPNGSLVLFQGWSNVIRTHSELANNFTLKNWIIYDRIKGRGTKKNLMSTREDILWYVMNEEDYTYNKISSSILKKTGGTIGRKNGNPFRSLSNVWSDISPIVPWSPERVKHPTQKPEQIMDRIIRVFSNEGDVVLDPFAGSGTTAVAAIKSGREYICFERDPDYFRILQERIDQIR